MKIIKTDVLIVGAGPTGLALATVLQQAGVDHLLVDALASGMNTSRAAVVHPHTIEMLAQLGIVNDLHAKGMPLKRFVVRDRDQALLEIGFEKLPSQFRHILMIPQPRTEDVLESRLVSLGGDVERSTRAVGIRQKPDGVEVELDAPDGRKLVKARFAVGADGMHSAVRQSTRIQFEGAAYGESFILADVRMDWPLGRDEVSLCFSPAGLVVVAPLPDGSFRVVATMDQAPETPTLEDVQSLLNERGSAKAGTLVHEVVWS